MGIIFLLILFLSNISISDSLTWWYVNLSSCRMKKMNIKNKYFYILLWTSPETNTKNDKIDAYFKNPDLYINESCIYKNCLFTHSKTLMDFKNYDAILFNGWNLDQIPKKHFPERNPKQLYAFVNFESAINYPVQSLKYKDFFNMTISYKLDSDIVSPYLYVQDKKGRRISPRKNIKWKTTKKEINKSLKKLLHAKTKLAAWFVSHCKTQSKRLEYVYKIKRALKKLGFSQTVDIYGDCGKLKCPISNNTQCTEMLSKDYMFYLAFENSFSEDYVTEKVLTAVQHDTVPIVYGGADYTRFLPPGSYINACLKGPNHLASLMVYLYNNRNDYEKYFNWRHLYEFVDPGLSYIDKLCRKLNKGKYNKRHKNFLNWWNENDKKNCKALDSYVTKHNVKNTNML